MKIFGGTSIYFHYSTTYWSNGGYLCCRTIYKAFKIENLAKTLLKQKIAAAINRLLSF